MRELRIAAARIFGLYFVDRPNSGLDRTVVSRKRKNALEFLKTLSDRDVMHLHESCIMVWGQVGRVVDDADLSLALLGLVEYLGHRNTIVSAWAFSEIMNVADSRGISPKRLFQPYWSSLAFSVVKDLVTKPQTASKVAELLQLPGGVPELLRLLQRHALPWLVFKKKRDVIQKFAEARGETESYEPCIDTANLASILALLLTQEVPDIASFAMSLLRNISQRFKEPELVDLLRTDALLVALELFKIAADGDENRRSRVSGLPRPVRQSRPNRPQVRTALATVGTLLVDPKYKKDKKSEIIGRYIEQHALGLASKLGETITDSLGSNPPMQDRRACIRTMEEMLRICRTSMCNARPQVCYVLAFC
jgi:serine/threonine-protein kinase ATR